MTSARPSFIADEMLGSLARWLRIMGYDTVYAKDRGDNAILEAAKEEGRYLLTRDKELAARMGEIGVYVVSDDLDAQLQQVAKRFELTADDSLVRCTVCNGELEVVDAERARGSVPEGALAANSVFFVCKNCGKFYWRGTHWINIRKKLESLSQQNQSR